MKNEFAKYYKKFAWMPVILKDGDKVWLKEYYRAHFGIVYMLDIKISKEQYIVYTLNGVIKDGYHNYYGLNIE